MITMNNKFFRNYIVFPSLQVMEEGPSSPHYESQASKTKTV